MEVAGLNVALAKEDLEESFDIHISELATLFVRHNAHTVLGIHLIHGHFAIPEQTVLLGTNATSIPSIDLDNIHGHIFILTKKGFYPYEYQVGVMPDLSQVSSTFLVELAGFLSTNGLEVIVGLQVLDESSYGVLKLVLGQGTTSWRFEVENSEPRVCSQYESHGQTSTGHEVYNKGSPHPKLGTFQDLKDLLTDAGIVTIA
ncbi:hypothetical protein B0T26DRAFT_743341 [Lasiosphaeria miniovina]|uniref:Uncharacterized protein n=1 Tax=Lasiosphaeria miniovina TaxID=1954250 RepID=A0AA40DQX6_9PEZI|nr:uncharacterized protein B0T26DRAFT_743341 [Lasiosphaeria miniovina]KAK0710196.1 hypothetical protein B0T26DRAFT_743341 [Lasiosphaeria miniovina]